MQTLPACTPFYDTGSSQALVYVTRSLQAARCSRFLSEGFAFCRAGSVQRALSYNKRCTAWESWRSSLCLGFKVERLQTGGGSHGPALVLLHC